MTKEHNLVQLEFSFSELHIKFYFPQNLLYSPQILPMLFYSLRVHKDVVDEHNHKIVQVRFEHAVHQVYKSSRSILQAE